MLGAVLAVEPAALFTGGSSPSHLDTPVQRVVDDSPTGEWNLIRSLDWLGDPSRRTVMTLVVALVCVIARRQAPAATAVVGIVTTRVLTVVLKPLVDCQIHDDFPVLPERTRGRWHGRVNSTSVCSWPIFYTLAASRLRRSCSSSALPVAAWAQIRLRQTALTVTLGIALLIDRQAPPDRESRK